MTDNDIIKALECCGGPHPITCKECPIIDNNFETHCSLELSNKALDLIKRQKAEIESLKEALKDLKHEMSYMASTNTIGDNHEMGCW